MTAIELAKRSAAEHRTYLIKLRKKGAPPYSYDAKPGPCGGVGSGGWLPLDPCLAAAIVFVYEGMTPERQEKFLLLDIFQMAKIAHKTLLEVNAAPTQPHPYRRE